jgi:hypothetical protein
VWPGGRVEYTVQQEQGGAPTVGTLQSREGNGVWEDVISVLPGNYIVRVDSFGVEASTSVKLGAESEVVLEPSLIGAGRLSFVDEGGQSNHPYWARMSHLPEGVGDAPTPSRLKTIRRGEEWEFIGAPGDVLIEYRRTEDTAIQEYETTVLPGMQDILIVCPVIPPEGSVTITFYKGGQPLFLRDGRHRLIEFVDQGGAVVQPTRSQTNLKVSRQFLSAQPGGDILLTKATPVADLPLEFTRCTFFFRGLVTLRAQVGAGLLPGSPSWTSDEFSIVMGECAELRAEFE